MMKRCDMCAGRFGLMIYRHYARRFCARHCKELYLKEMRQRAHVASVGASKGPDATIGQQPSRLASNAIEQY
jgi:hypothetical protein